MTKLPQPNFTIFRISDLGNHISELMSAELKEAPVSMTISVEPDSLEITADRALIERIMINLIKNAIETADGTTAPGMSLGARPQQPWQRRTAVADSGPGDG